MWEKASFCNSNRYSDSFSCAACQLSCTFSLVVELLIERTRVALILYFSMVAHKAAHHALSKAFLKLMKTSNEFILLFYRRHFLYWILLLKICSVVHLSALSPGLNIKFDNFHERHARKTEEQLFTKGGHCQE